MKKVNLNNLYESHYPPTDINVLWVDKDENTGKIKAIHEYNKSKGEWEPNMVSVDYIKPETDIKVLDISDATADTEGNHTCDITGRWRG